MFMGHSKWSEVSAAIRNNPERKARALARRTPAAAAHVELERAKVDQQHDTRAT